ncbi:MAG: hypothetical protein ACM3RX_09345 [Methanococcaceae archaeon]
MKRKTKPLVIRIGRWFGNYSFNLNKSATLLVRRARSGVSAVTRISTSGDNEVLINTNTVNRTDCGFRKPEYLYHLKY